MNLILEDNELGTISSASSEDKLSISAFPAIPDVAIQYVCIIRSATFVLLLTFISDVYSYRCGDNLLLVSVFGYGLVPFHAILRLIPSDAEFVYVLTNDNFKHPYCRSVIEVCTLQMNLR